MNSRKKGLSAVFGFIVIFMLLMAGLEAISAIVATQGSVATAQQEARQIESSKSIEHLAVSLNGSYLQVTNDGLIPSTLAYLYQASSTDSKDSRINETLAAGSITDLPIQTAMERFAIVTSLGNVFMASAAQTSGSDVTVTFDASGAASSFGSASILTVDGASYNYSELPKTFEWAAGTVHEYSYADSFPSADGSRIGWSYSRGLATSREGSLTADQAGSVVSYYSLQYLLSVTGGSAIQFLGSPAGDGWYDAGTTAQVTSNYSWSTTLNQSRQNLVAYSLDGSTPVGVQRSGSGLFTSESIVMDSPHTLDLVSMTQYYLSLSESWFLVPGASLTADWSYASPTSVGQGLQNPGFESGSISPWSYSPGAGVESQTVHSGTYAAYLEPGTFTIKGRNYCCSASLSQNVAVPSGATLTSFSIAVWYYVPTTDTGGDVVSVTLEACGVGNGPSGSTTGSWVELTYSWSGSCLNPTALQYIISVSGSSSADKVYVDDAALSYTYGLTSSGAVSSPVTATASGGSILYSFAFGYPFPQGAYDRSLTVSFPFGETFEGLLVGSGPSLASPSTYTQSGDSLTLPDSTIGTDGDSFTLETTSSGSYTVSQAGSQTDDGWYDSGTAAVVTALFSTPFSFSSWVGAPTIASPTQASTSVLMSSYCSVEGLFEVSQ